MRPIQRECRQERRFVIRIAQRWHSCLERERKFKIFKERKNVFDKMPKKAKSNIVLIFKIILLNNKSGLCT